MSVVIWVMSLSLFIILPPCSVHISHEPSPLGNAKGFRKGAGCVDCYSNPNEASNYEATSQEIMNAVPA
jgi:hypothetical protein